MAQPVTQMATDNNTSNAAFNRNRNRSFEMPVHQNRGLETGARGWRWVVAAPQLNHSASIASGR